MLSSDSSKTSDYHVDYAGRAKLRGLARRLPIRRVAGLSVALLCVAWTALSGSSVSKPLEGAPRNTLSSVSRRAATPTPRTGLRSHLQDILTGWRSSPPPVREAAEEEDTEGRGDWFEFQRTYP